jgi:hypothetical protein
MHRACAAFLAAVLVVLLAAVPACRPQAEQREPVTRVPAVPPPPQTIPPDMPPPPADQRLPAPAAAPAPAEPTPTPAIPPAGTPAPAPAPAHAELPVLATYARSGGILGLNETMTVYDNGRLELVLQRGREPARRVETQVDAAQLLALRRIFEDEEFHALEARYVNTRGADLITYTIRAHTPRGERRVVATDGMNLPRPLSAAIEEFEGLRGMFAAAPPQ